MRRRALALLAALAVAIAGTVATLPSAASAAETFDPGNIIDDSLFYDSSAMTAAQIQSFLDSKIGTCKSNDCINILRASVSSRPARISDSTGNLICDAFTGGTNLRISDIIYRAQVACGISAKVILVTLQKEQGLVTSTDPTDWNLNYAMGQACPDTAPCDPAYMGIGVQIISGATQLKTYKAARFARQPGVHNIQYSPTASCGTKRITIENYATAALYNYTPYTPNDAALRNLYGIGDGCSSYGNRNFWRDYIDWFGSVRSTSVQTIDTVTHVLALESSGALWAYPSKDGRWMARVSLDGIPSGTGDLIAPGDFDGDGHRDLITITAQGTAQLHRGNGALGYHPATDLGGDFSDARLVAAAGDLSRDGIPDLVSLNSSGEAHLWRGTDAGTFRAPVTIARGWQIVNMLIGAGDLDGDGRSDLLVRRTDGTLVFYRGDGRGKLLNAVKVSTGWGSLTAILVPGDFDGDGKSDVLARTRTGALRLYPGTGDGRVRAGKQIGSGWGAFSHLEGGGMAASGPRATSVGVGDLDDDGYRDFVSLTSTGQLRLSRGNGGGGIIATSKIAPQIPAGARLFTLGDFDSDGIHDLGMIDTNGELWLLSGKDAGGYAPPVSLGTGWGSLHVVFGGIDFDGDGHVDILARTNTGLMRMYPGAGDGTWAPGIQIGSGWGEFTAIFTPGDFDGDGEPDVMARRADGVLLLYPTNGKGQWKAPYQIGSGWGSFTALFSPGEFAHLGGPDVFARRPDGSLVLYKSNGNGKWTGTVETGSGWGGVRWLG